MKFLKCAKSFGGHGQNTCKSNINLNSYNSILIVYMVSALWSYAAMFADTGASLYAQIEKYDGECLHIEGKTECK